MEQLKNLWAQKSVRQGVIFSGIGALVVFIGISMSEDDTSSQLAKIEKMAVPVAKNGSLFGSTSGLEQISSQEAQDVVSKMTAEMRNRETEVNRREQEMKEINEKMLKRQQQLEAQLFEQKQQLQALSRGTGTVTPDTGPVRQRQSVNQSQTMQSVQAPAMPTYDAQGNLINQSQTQIVTENRSAASGGQVIRTVTQRHVREFKDGKINERPVEIHTLNARNQRAAQVPTVAQAKQPLSYEEEEGLELFTLSMGSIISGTLLNGVAAPTSSDRKQEPMPVLLRVKREALMPNHYTLDIVDCHMLGSAIGDLSSNRAYIRAEAISCNTHNGEAIEKPITAYAVSSTDGMAGVEGEVVFKSGAMIANSLKASFIQGFADAFSPRRVQSLNTAPGATELWQDQNIDRATGAGIGQGFSGAAGRLADKYMDMADSAHPVIELVPGIEVDFIVQRGMTLKMGGREAPYTGNRGTDKSNDAFVGAPNANRGGQQTQRAGTNITLSVQ